LIVWHKDYNEKYGLVDGESVSGDRNGHHSGSDNEPDELGHRSGNNRAA